MNTMRPRSLKCPFCGQSDPDDNESLWPVLDQVEYNRQSAELVEIRVCDICHKSYRVKMHYGFCWEEYDVFGQFSEKE